MWTVNFQMIKVDLEKAEEPEIKCQHPLVHRKSKRIPEEHIPLGAGGEGDDRGWDGWMASLTQWAWVWVNSGSWWWWTGRPGVLWFIGSQRVGHDWATELNWTSLLTAVKPFTVENCGKFLWKNCGKFFKRWEYQTTLPASWEICLQVKKQQLRLDMEQWTGSKLENEYIKDVYCHPACSTYMQSTSCKMPGWMKHMLESRLPGKVSITQICRWHHPYGSKWRRPKEPLDESERGEWKTGLKLNIQKTKIMASSPITSWQIDGETMEIVRDFIFLGYKITLVGDCSHEIKDTWSLEENLW